MAANAYKTQTDSTDKAIDELLIAGFLGQLKGWWDYHLTPVQQLQILFAIQYLMMALLFLMIMVTQSKMLCLL